MSGKPTRRSFTSKASLFITRVKKILDRNIGIDRYALFLFGSLNRGDHCTRLNGTSDVDLLVLLDDGVSREVVKRIRRIMFNLENREFFPRVKESIVHRILRAVERQTGMHENIFISPLNEFKQCNLSTMFRTNRIISKLLAPRDAVIGSVLDNIQLLSGNEDFVDTIKRVKLAVKAHPHRLGDLVKSALMNLALAMGAILILPITGRATRYAVEATKWSLYTTFYHLAGTRITKKILVRVFSMLGINDSFLEQWRHISERYEQNVCFTVRTPLQVLKIHLLGFRFKRTIEMREPSPTRIISFPRD